MTPPRGLLVGTAVVLGVVWALYLLDPSAWPGLTGAWIQTAALLGNLALTSLDREATRRIVAAVQRRVVNPLVGALWSIGVNPLGLVMLETRGRVSGLPRRTPVGNGREGPTVWIIAEHGLRAGYVRNLLADPRVRVGIRRGRRLHWITGTAHVLPEDDVLARQRRIVKWHPLRALNALTVRVLGTDLVTVRVDLDPDRKSHAGPDRAGVAA